MYEVSVRKSFSAAHTLKIGGKCETLHGHNFLVEVTVSAGELDREELVIDFRLLKKWTSEILEELDHKYLNELPLFRDINPTSENIARIIYENIKEKIDKKDVSIEQVTVWESESSRATYRSGEKW